MLGHEGHELGDDVEGHALRALRPLLAPTLLRLTSSRAGIPDGEVLALAARVTTLAEPGSVETATGTVSFRTSGRLLGTATVDSAGEAVLDGLHLPVGVHAVTASYSGDARHAAASSPPLPQAVLAAAAPVVVLVSPATRTSEGVLLEAEIVDPSSGRLAEDATGCLLFSAAGTPLGQAPLQGGRARLLLPEEPSARVRVTFPGDTEHAAAAGSAPPLAAS